MKVAEFLAPAGSVCRLFAATGAVILLSGCAGFYGAGATPEAIVTERAEARWAAVIAGDWESAYSYAAPAYRAAVSLDAFKGMTAGAIVRKSAKVQSISCAESSCEVVVRMTYTPALQRGFGELTTDFGERWIEEDGRWYIFQRF